MEDMSGFFNRDSEEVTYTSELDNVDYNDVEQPNVEVPTAPEPQPEVVTGTAPKQENRTGKHIGGPDYVYYGDFR